MNLKAAMEDIILQYTYPRLDAEVSKHRNHLLKSPFCIHPKTSRVCVPIDPERIDEFDPETVPTVGQLLRELDEAAKKRKEEGDVMDADEEGKEKEARAGQSGVYLDFLRIEDVGTDWEKTSLRPYVAMLDKHVAALMNEARLTKRATGGELFPLPL
jgi:DNA primase small subunit